MTANVPLPPRPQRDVIALALVRRQAWWNNKLPLSVLLFMLLADGAAVSSVALFTLAALVLTVCAVANLGYAINELFDREEDARAARHNAAAAGGLGVMWTAVWVSAALACAMAALAGGHAALVLTAAVLLLPLAYSIPPLRLKERGWLGILADATAAHAYPAALALLLVTQQHIATVTTAQVTVILTWAWAAGLRGILSHQLHTDARDAAGGLRTVVHAIGHARVRRMVMLCILPVEIVAFAGAVLLADITPWVGVAAALVVACEWLKWRSNAVPSIAFNPAGEHYVPYIDEAAYKVWGPMVLIIDAALRDAWWLVLLPLFIVLFRPRLRVEWLHLRAAFAA